MDEAPQGGGSADVGGSEGVGETTAPAVEAPEGGEAEAPARQYVEVDDPDNRYVRVKVDGEDTEVPFSEAVRGYSRTEDYTRKTQEIARQREEAEFGMRLQQALQANPQTTLQILAQNYGLNLSQPEQQPPPAAPTFDDPLEEQIYYERQARLSLEDRLAQRDADAELDRAVTGMRQQFNLNDEDLRAVVNIAYQNQWGPETFPHIWKSMAYDRIAAQVKAQRDAAAAAEQSTQQRQQAAAAASQIVSNGTGGANGLTNQVDPADRHMSIREAIELAMDQHGV